MACEKAEAFRRTFFTLGWLPAPSERGFSSKAAPVTLPILFPIKIYREHPGKRRKATIITTCLSNTNKHTNHRSPNKKGEIFSSPFELTTGTPSAVMIYNVTSGAKIAATP